ncbi:MAG: type III-A CRISPR-associated protein Csm2 [Planctomycetes bacterium]|nr:type III-A CRISPR-associated protein Csm2 [Planctomycetota bacterium]
MPAPNREHRRAHPEQSLAELWPNYLKGGYFDANGHPRLEYVARATVEPLVRAMSRAHPELKPHQLRRFFQHCRAIEARLKARTSSWGAELTQVMKLDSAAADAFGKSQPKIPALFHEFIRENVAAVKTETDFLDGFLRHFEALVGFGSQHLQERERN